MENLQIFHFFLSFLKDVNTSEACSVDIAPVGYIDHCFDIVADWMVGNMAEGYSGSLDYTPDIEPELEPDIVVVADYMVDCMVDYCSH